jgi:heme/copper-type cytochrome/quinol oxidase subunit 2
MDIINKHQDTITNYMYLGLLPFFAGALGPWIFAENEWWFTQMFLWYSSIIYSFLAGAIWAIALFAHSEERATYISRNIHAAIIFSLIPLFSVMLPAAYHAGVMLLAFLTLLFWEKLFINVHYPSWYQQLRHRITYIAVACHMLVIWNIIRVDSLG